MVSCCRSVMIGCCHHFHHGHGIDMRHGVRKATQFRSWYLCGNIVLNGGAHGLGGGGTYVVDTTSRGG